MSDKPIDRGYVQILVISFAMLVVAPVLYALIAVMLDPEQFAGTGFSEFVLYILLILAIAQPGIVPFIQRLQQSRVDGEGATGSATGLFQTRTIVRLAMVEAIYIYGLVVFLISGQLAYLWYFYPIGIVWTIVLWPRRSSYERFVRERKNR